MITPFAFDALFATKIDQLHSTPRSTQRGAGLSREDFARKWQLTRGERIHEVDLFLLLSEGTSQRDNIIAIRFGTGNRLVFWAKHEVMTTVLAALYLTCSSQQLEWYIIYRYKAHICVAFLYCDAGLETRKQFVSKSDAWMVTLESQLQKCRDYYDEASKYNRSRVYGKDGVKEGQYPEEVTNGHPANEVLWEWPLYEDYYDPVQEKRLPPSSFRLKDNGRLPSSQLLHSCTVTPRSQVPQALICDVRV